MMGLQAKINSFFSKFVLVSFFIIATGKLFPRLWAIPVMDMIVEVFKGIEVCRA